MESFLKNPFQNPFGGAMNPSGGGGVLEQIQEQVNTNGETLQSLQGGIGGLPSGNLPPGGIGGGHRGPGSPGTVKPSPIQGGGSTPAPPSTPSPPPMVTGPGGDLPPNDMNIINPPDFFGKINVDELNKQHPGIDQGFFASDEYNKFHYDPGNMMGTMDVRFSDYFGSQGSGSIGGAQDAAYEDYLKRIGKSDLIGKTIPGLDKNPFNPGLSDNSFIGQLQNLEMDAEQNPGMDYSQLTPTMGPLQKLGMDRGGHQTPGLGMLRGMDQSPELGMDQLFGRAFAGKPV